MILFDYRLNGKPWTGVATVGTDSPTKYGGTLWNFYYSGVGVPAGSDPSVGVGLLRSWKSWNPSGAIAARTRQAIALINETNEIWRQTTRVQVADSRPPVARRRLPPPGVLHHRGQLTEVRPAAAPLRADLHRAKLSSVSKPRQAAGAEPSAQRRSDSPRTLVRMTDLRPRLAGPLRVRRLPSRPGGGRPRRRRGP